MPLKILSPPLTVTVPEEVWPIRAHVIEVHVAGSAGSTSSLQRIEAVAGGVK